MKTIIFKASIVTKLTVLVVAVLLTTGCGSKAAKNKQALEGKDSADITRPPSFVKETQVRETESNPEETVSYDEWLKRRGGAAVPIESDSEIQEIEEPEEPTKIP